MSPSVRVIAALIVSYAAGFIGFLFIDSQVTTWYAGVVKPPFTPHPSVFIIVWIVLYAFMALALSVIWTKTPQDIQTGGWVRFFFVQLLFNAGWTFFFFGLHSTLIAFVDILFLAFIVVTLVAGAYEIDPRAGWLLLPYLLWVLFAGYINLGIWLLN